MRTLSTIWAAIYFSELYMVASAGAFVWLCARWMGVTLDGRWYAMACAGCWWVYLVDAGLFRVPEEDQVNAPNRAAFMQRWRGVLLIAVGAATAGAAAWMFTGPIALATWALAAVEAGIAGAYVLPVLPGKTRWLRLKDLATVKPVVISAAWLCGAMGLAVTQGRSLGAEVVHEWLIGALMVLLLLADSIALDWKDREGDTGIALRTIATRLTGRSYDVLMTVMIALAVGVLIAGIIRGGGAIWWGPAVAMIITLMPSLWAARHVTHHRVAVGTAIAAWRFIGAAVALIIIR